MATTMKTIKFGENGEVYAVNTPAVQVSGELTEASNLLDFGTFEDGLTDITIVTKGGSGGKGDYYHLVINGNKTGFISGGVIYSGVHCMTLKKVGDMWFAGYGLGNAVSYAMEILNNGVDKITSLAIQGYDTTQFVAGTKYALEGR